MSAASLRARTVAALLAAALVPSLALGVVWYRTAVDAVTRSVNGGLVAAASRAAASIEGLTNSSLDAVRTQAQLPSMRAAFDPDAEAQRYAREALETLRSADVLRIVSYTILAPDGRVLISTDEALPRGARVDDAVLLAVTTQVVPVLTPLRMRDGDPSRSYFRAGAPVRDAGGRVAGILYAEYNGSVLEEVLREQTVVLGAEARGVLYDERFVRIAGTLAPEDLFQTTNPLPDSVRSAMIADGRYLAVVPNAEPRIRRMLRDLVFNADSTRTYRMEHVSLNGMENWLAAGAPLRSRNWSVSVEVPQGAALGPTTTALLRGAILLGGVIALLLLVAAFVIAGRLTDPLTTLAETARRFAAGDREARAPVPSTDEIGEVARAFNDLADRVGLLVTGLNERTRQLEADIAERERLEHELMQTRKLEAVGKLAGGIAHDFNNLLTVVSQNAELAREDAGVSDSVREALDDIVDASQRGAGLTRQLLTFARRGGSSPRVVDVTAAIQGSERLLRQLLGSHVRVEIVPPERPALVMIDPAQFEQVLVNLTANARDAMPRGGVMRVEIRTHDAVELAVRDTGTGMPREVLARIFEPFFTTKESSRGTGLGLSTVYGIVTQAGGSVSAESTPGEGTTFTLRFPLASGEVEGPSAPSEAPNASGRRATILVVEDEVAVRHAVTRTLRRLGHTVHEASDGEEGIVIGRLHLASLDLVISDVVMPGADGFTVAETLTAERPGLRVLLISGYSTEAREQFGRRSDPYPLLEKPFSLAALAARVDRLLGASAG